MIAIFNTTLHVVVAHAKYACLVISYGDANTVSSLEPDTMFIYVRDSRIVVSGSVHSVMRLIGANR